MKIRGFSPFPGGRPKEETYLSFKKKKAFGFYGSSR